MKPINKTSSSTLVSAGLDYHHINDLKREFAITQKIIEKIPYTEGNKFVFTLDDFLGKHFKGLGLTEFKYKAIDIIYRFERLGLCKKVWVGKSRGLETLMSFKPEIKRLERYQNLLEDKIRLLLQSDTDDIKEIKSDFLQANTVTSVASSLPPNGNYHINNAQITWNGETKRWKTTYKNKTPNVLKLIEYLFLNYLDKNISGEIDSNRAYEYCFGTRLGNTIRKNGLKQLENLCYALRLKLKHIFKDNPVAPQKVITWKNKSIHISL